MPNYAWDTSVFLAWIQEEQAAPLDDIALVVAEIDSGTSNLIVSVEIYSEVLETKQTPEQFARFEQFLKRSNVVLIDKTQPIARKAGEIRSRGLAEGRKINGPDATVMATAILAGADVLHSLDDRHHIALSGSSIVDGLRITRPQLFSGQKSLPLVAKPDDADRDG